jgi:hypothetical protein
LEDQIETFEIKSFLPDGSSVPGFAFVPFMNNRDSKYYRDPIVVVKPNSNPKNTKGDGGELPFDKIECTVSLHDGDVTQRVVQGLNYILPLV